MPVVAGKWYPIEEVYQDAEGKGWIDLDGELDIGPFDPGVHELRIGVKDVRSNQTVERTVPFGIL